MSPLRDKFEIRDEHRRARDADRFAFAEDESVRPIKRVGVRVHMREVRSRERMPADEVDRQGRLAIANESQAQD